MNSHRAGTGTASRKSFHEALSTTSNDIATALSPSTNLDRSAFSVIDSIIHLLESINIPGTIAEHVSLPGQGLGLPSSFKIGHLAQTSIALTALLASLYNSLRPNSKIHPVTVPLQHAAIEFCSEHLYSINGISPSFEVSIGGLHKTADGFIRLHDSFPNHRNGAKQLLGCSGTASRADVAGKIAKWKALDLESAAVDANVVASALRSYEQWDALPHAKAISDFPISVTKIADGPAVPPLFADSKKCLNGVKVLEMTRVIAAPLAGRTLAVHGADILWITSPELPDLPELDRDLARGKRTACLNIDKSGDRGQLDALLAEADVFIQSFRPGSLDSKGLDGESLAARSQQGIVCANLSAYGPDGPWAKRRGFDSLVQTCSGMNVSEAEHFGEGQPARPTPCQALDHAGGYFLAAGITAALYRRATEGGSYRVDVSLARVMKYLRSLGQFEAKTGFECKDYNSSDDVPDEFMSTSQSAFGLMRYVKHSAAVEDMEVGWDSMPKPLGADEPRWL